MRSSRGQRCEVEGFNLTFLTFWIIQFVLLFNNSLSLLSPISRSGICKHMQMVPAGMSKDSQSFTSSFSVFEIMHFVQEKYYLSWPQPAWTEYYSFAKLFSLQRCQLHFKPGMMAECKRESPYKEVVMWETLIKFELEFKSKLQVLINVQVSFMSPEIHEEIPFQFPHHDCPSGTFLQIRIWVQAINIQSNHSQLNVQPIKQDCKRCKRERNLEDTDQASEDHFIKSWQYKTSSQA